MTQSAATSVTAFFAAATRDWTPPAVRDTARVLFAPISQDAEVTRLCASVLSADELQRAAKFLTEEARTRFIQRRAFRRYCGALALGAKHELAEIAFAETDKGRPHLPRAPNLSFSFSSTRFGYLAAWSATHDVGVDIEDQTRVVEAIALSQRFFTKAEADAVARADGSARIETFFRLWTLKEAALKSVGEGLPFGLDAFEFALAPTPQLSRAPRNCGGRQRFGVNSIGVGEFRAALVTAQRGSQLSEASRVASLTA